MDVPNPPYAGIATMMAVVDDDGKAVAICNDLSDAAAFCRCLGYDNPIAHMEVVPIVSFAKERDAR
ncbi:MAG: hypothetical protein IJ087_14510 [Eggerthellaceae bacterium]|nr:hypothetical protein [Eggerthellaceae bacterium]